MNKLTIYNIKFSSYLKLCISSGLVFGVCLGILNFLVGLFGGNVFANFGSIKYTGITAGLIALFSLPFIFSIFAFIMGLTSFIPLKLTLKLFKGLNIYGDFNSSDIS